MTAAAPLPPLMLEPADDAVAVLRAAGGDSVVVVIRPGRDATAQAMARAAVAALALERAPTRINAVEPGEGTDPAAIDAAVAYLASAPSVTGQVVALS